MRHAVRVLTVLPLALAGPLRADEPRDLVRRAVAAHGGEERLARVGVCRIRLRGDASAELGAARLDLEYLIQLPGQVRFRETTNVGGETSVLVVAVDGDRAVASFNGARQEVTPDEKAVWRALLHRLRVASLVPLLRDDRFSLRPLGETTLEGRDAVGVLAVYPGQDDVALYFDRQTHLLLWTGSALDARAREGVLHDQQEAGVLDERVLRRHGVATDAASLVAYVRSRAPDPAVTERVRRLIAGLGDDAFEVREKASKELTALGAAAVPLLKEAARDEDLEVSRRARDCLQAIDVRGQDEALAAAVRLAATLPDGAAAEALLALLPGAEPDLADEVRAALASLAGRDDPAAVLRRAAEDAGPFRRGAARAALGLDGGAYLGRPGRPLFLPGVVQSLRRVGVRGADRVGERVVVELRFFNRLDDREFTLP